MEKKKADISKRWQGLLIEYENRANSSNSVINFIVALLTKKCFSIIVDRTSFILYS